MLKPEVDRMRGLLVEAITTLCRSGLQYNSNLKVEGLIGITLDEADIILVNLNRSFGSVMDNNIKRKRKRKRRKTRNTDSTGSESESSESDRDDTSVTRDQSSAGARRTDESFDLNNTNTQPDVSPESGDTSSHIPDSLPRDKRVPALGEAAETHSSPQTGALTQGNRTSPNDSKAVIKIEIDSDAEVEEVKYEPGQKTDLWNVSMSAQSCPVSDGLTLQTDMSSRLAGIPGGVENTPEFLQSHLPPELAAETQQDQNLQSSYFSGPQPVPGPSGFAMATPGGSTYSPDMQSSMVFPVQTNSQKIKVNVIEPEMLQKRNEWKIGPVVTGSTGHTVPSKLAAGKHKDCAMCSDRKAKKRVRTRYYCALCGNIALCLWKCWNDYHASK